MCVCVCVCVAVRVCVCVCVNISKIQRMLVKYYFNFSYRNENCTWYDKTIKLPIIRNDPAAEKNTNNVVTWPETHSHEPDGLW